ncbi:hypothetical protein [Muriicola soli]|uniref:Uncharacterized protein n=1 Tax=Muriicola soli TaxID=2507538 RepID=A0A411ECJ5_9FLAO|nr:hypothetical protein [Muriicola soli]QBA65223.1 hypothetical protein EQY75_12185 [Muriicola soli]
MKIRFTLFLLLSFTILQINAQRQSPASRQTEIAINALHITVDSFEELQDVDWSEIREIFRDNKSDEIISIGFSLKDQIQRNNYTMDSFEFTLKGKTEEVESMISKTKRIIASLAENQ